MDNEQLLKAISEMMDKKLKLELQPIKEHLDKLDTRMDMMEVIMKRTVKKLDDLQLDVKIAERDIRRDIHDLNDEMETVIEILRMNDMLPR
jgi:predicted  nucleic acid-binding Zn-ribbon protein